MRKNKKSLGKRLSRMNREGIGLAGDDLVRELDPGDGLPLPVEPTTEGVDLAAWLADHRPQVEDWLARHGAVLFRGFGVADGETFEAAVRALSGDLLDYTYRSTPRSRVSGNVFTSTEYPAEQHIPMHNEMSYSLSWPRKIWFCCVQEPAAGGETPLADSHRVWKRVDAEVRERFQRLGVLYVRNYGPHFDLPWQSVFQAETRQQVNEFCAAHGIEVEWQGEDRLRTRQRCQGVATHPGDGRGLWFNQAHLFHVSSLAPAAREALLETFGEEGLPRNAYYGDGSPLEEDVLDHVRECYEEEKWSAPWRHGDVVLVDNMAVAHGRAPYEPPRRILAAMAEPWDDPGAGAAHRDADGGRPTR